MNALDVLHISIFHHSLSFTVRRYGERLTFKEWLKGKKFRRLGEGRVALDLPGRYGFVWERWEN